MSAVASGGRVESQTAFQAVIVYGQQVNNVLHAILSIFSCGLWVLIWLILLASGGETRRIIQIDPYGEMVTN